MYARGTHRYRYALKYLCTFHLHPRRRKFSRALPKIQPDPAISNQSVENSTLANVASSM
jgi:hypothetical protein